jgi:hypothetical protein
MRLVVSLLSVLVLVLTLVTQRVNLNQNVHQLLGDLLSSGSASLWLQDWVDSLSLLPLPKSPLLLKDLYGLEQELEGRLRSTFPVQGQRMFQRVY